MKNDNFPNMTDEDFLAAVQEDPLVRMMQDGLKRMEEMEEIDAAVERLQNEDAPTGSVS